MSEGASGGTRTALLIGTPLLALSLLVWPLGGRADDPYPQLFGAGVACLAALVPALALVAGPGLARPVRTLPLLFLLGALAFAVLGLARGSVTDTLAARASLVLWGAFPALLLAGAGLTAAGRRLLCDALVLLSLACTSVALAGAFAGTPPDPARLAGVLGNTGPLSQAALPGALIGALRLFSAQGSARTAAARRLAGAASVLLFALHAALAPVLAGALAFAAAASAAFLLRPRSPHGRAALGCAALVLAALSLPRAGSAQDTPEGTAAGDLGGIEVRALLWKRVPALLAAHPLGVGPGQLQAAFPPLRDARERALSDGARGPSEVEHLHSDALQGLAELGLVGGACWIGFLLAAALACLGRLRGGEDERVAPAAALFGLLVNGLVHTPLSVQPVSALAGLLLAGVVLARPSGVQSGLSVARSRWQRWVPLATLAAVPFAPALVRHGLALEDYVDAARRIDARLSELSAAGTAPRPDDPVLPAAARDAQAALERALAAAPDSAVALLLWARQAQPAERIAAWEAVLARRPHQWEALANLAALCARAGQPERAEELAERARALAPER